MALVFNMTGDAGSSGDREGKTVTITVQNNTNYLIRVYYMKKQTSGYIELSGYGESVSVGQTRSYTVYYEHPDDWNVLHVFAPAKTTTASLKVSGTAFKSYMNNGAYYADVYYKKAGGTLIISE